MKKITILADFPKFILTGNEKDRPASHYATWLPQLALALESQQKFSISWIIIDKGVNEFQQFEAWGQKFYYLPRWKKTFSMLSAYWHERRSIASLLNEISPDLIHAWGSEGVYGLALTDAGEGQTLLSMQGILTRYCRVTSQSWRMRLQAYWEKRVLKQVKQITCESPWGIKMCQLYAPNANFQRLEYGVRGEYFEVSREPDQKKLALYVGGFNRLKGSDTLLEAFASDKLKDISLKILGATAESAGVEELPENVEFLGRLPPDEVKIWMSRAWCLVHPTLADTSPNCVKEARVVGLPVVTTPEGGQVQYVEHGKSGWLHEPGDVDCLIEGVLKVTESVLVSMEMGSYRHAECREELRPELTACRLLDIYDEM